MKRKFIVWIAFLVVIGCQDDCPLGEPCTRSCPTDTSALCAPHQMCVCAARGDGVPTPNESGPPPCPKPQRGDLVITEVLIDGEPTEKEEFVEIVNVGTTAVNLDGVVLLAPRGQRLSNRVLFGKGCMAPKTAVAMYTDLHRWVWVPKPRSP